MQQLLFMMLEINSTVFLNYIQMAEHLAMPTLVLAVDQSSWMMSSVPQVLANY